MTWNIISRHVPFNSDLSTVQQDMCLAEVSLSLALNGDVSLPDLRPGRLGLNVRTLLAELHEGLFLSQLSIPPGTTPLHCTSYTAG